MRRISILLCAVAVTAMACTAGAKSPPPTIEALRDAKRDVTLEFVRDVDGGPGYSAELYRYASAGLRVHALVARPDGPPPARGWPVLIANHGHHPDPPRYGITAEGKDHRPGDYYRRIPELYVSRGYLVVMPDFRGHNDSEGLAYTEGMLEAAYYVEDVLNLLAGVGDIEGADTDRVFMWGHSMGGDVTLRALLATDRIRAAALWSSVGGDLWDQAYNYSRYENPAAPDSSETEKAVISELRRDIDALDDDFVPENPHDKLDELDVPLIIQHAVGDRSAAWRWSEALARNLYLRGKTYEFWSFAGDEHLFGNDDMELAADRDAAFFRRFEGGRSPSPQESL